ncbi:MAG: hypothetical protein KJ811_01305, partial [Candidatus Margulisbacteria bacterium]|nr:hypothetical protein [Candidatus Margulisiibacteriota bacterium]
EHFLLENLTDEKVKSYFSKLLISEHLTGEKQQGEILSDCIQVLRQERSRQKIGALKLKIKAAEEAGETGAVGELLTLLKSEIY